MKQYKKALLAVSFGTSCASSREAAIGGIEHALQQAFPDRRVRRAFTSGFIIRKILRETGEKIDTVEEALQRALSDGVRDLLVQPTHFMKGLEYDQMKETMESYRGRFEKLVLAEPLLASSGDYRAVVDAMVSGTGGNETATGAMVSGTGENEAVILMGHGTSKADANAVYETLQNTFTEAGHGQYYIATVEAAPSIDDIMQQIQEKGYRNITLRPLMLVAGDHACNDMAGEEEDSWKSKLEKAGYEVQAIMRGLGEEPAIREIYISHAREALSRQDAECRPADGTSGNSSRFFANKDCQYYPCHEGQDPFNCMFCYCPFYLLEKCPGTPVWIKSKKTGRQIKDCTPCTFPHKPESYDVIINWIIKQNEKS